jgi:hypothetical protein
MSLAVDAKELARDLRVIAQGIESNPEKLQNSNDRYSQLQSLFRKHNVDSSQGLIEKLTSLQSEQAGETVLQEKIGELQDSTLRLQSDRQIKANSLHKKRLSGLESLCSQVVDQLVQLKLFVTGQVCVTANRIFVPDVLHEQVIDRLISKLESSKVEDGLNDSSQNRVDAGPLIHSQACVGVDALVDEACKNGAKVAYRYAFGREDRSKGEGSFYAPTVLSHVVDDMRISKGEIFGPVFAIHTYRTVDEVIQRANSVSQGLAGYVYGTDLSDCRRVARKLDVGIVGVNEWRPLKAEIPFGGIKESGIGSEGGIEGLSEYLRLRVISLPKD